MAANIFITWTETEHKFDRWVADKYGQEERFFSSKPVTKKAAWMDNVLPISTWLEIDPGIEE